MLLVNAQKLGLGFLGLFTVNHNAMTQLFQIVVGNQALDLGNVRFLNLEAGMHQLVCQGTIIG